MAMAGSEAFTRRWHSSYSSKIGVLWWKLPLRRGVRDSVSNGLQLAFEFGSCLDCCASSACLGVSSISFCWTRLIEATISPRSFDRATFALFAASSDPPPCQTPLLPRLWIPIATFDVHGWSHDRNFRTRVSLHSLGLLRPSLPCAQERQLCRARSVSHHITNRAVARRDSTLHPIYPLHATRPTVPPT